MSFGLLVSDIITSFTNTLSIWLKSSLELIHVSCLELMFSNLLSSSLSLQVELEMSPFLFPTTTASKLDFTTAASLLLLASADVPVFSSFTVPNKKPMPSVGLSCDPSSSMLENGELFRGSAPGA
jgi:hypothetical protein